MKKYYSYSFLIFIFLFFLNLKKIKGNDDFRYYGVRVDKRTCQGGIVKCGGYFVKLLNTGKDEPEIYVSEIFQMDSFISEGKLRYAPDYHVIIRGDLNLDFQNDVYQAEAYNLYRLMPIPGREFTLKNDTTFFTLGNPHNLLVPTLPETERNKFDCLKNHYSKYVTNVQENWLEYLINTGNSVFTVNNELYKSEDEKISSNKNIESSIKDYNIEYLFISLTNSNNCPKKMQEIRCVEGLVATYVRSFNHCYIFFECAPRSKDKNICMASPPPRCPRNYSLTSIPSYPNGCLKYYCDPTFLLYNIA
ncbi:hypothetical protein DICPUDRAFT_92671 [Dictyostelium purpureum]|uniref:Uncharacterized protein n=1 Tax=Dictyostelium purpureum TaxID=5786 RepID=F0ZVK3_DICPU|nr:uncharacterized protein DICPUDRAFT_92671 [Dictyostelium purpureum]EGC32025.1 hypothetical protein DICPUDRAFT_92671 [Dictyostelium purpureum]|eukprot:XP_003291443.1 hypothetical protein DICPUDRAFT_92671 [Dictyostelium purpureum]